MESNGESQTKDLQQSCPTPSATAQCEEISSKTTQYTVSAVLIGLLFVAVSLGLGICLIRKAYRKKKDAALLSVNYQNEPDRATINATSTAPMVENDLYEVGIPSPTQAEVSRSKLQTQMMQENEYQDLNPYEAIR